MLSHRNVIEKILTSAGIAVNGNNPWDIQIKDERAFSQMLQSKNVGLGEAYMAGWWDCERLDEFIYRILKSGLDTKIKEGYKFLIYSLSAAIFNMQSQKRSRMVVEQHYNLDNDLFMSFLDPYNQYSCAYFDGTQDLNDAQIKKMDLICKKIDLRQSDHVLDIGCGWGGLAGYMAKHYDGMLPSIAQIGKAIEGLFVMEDLHNLGPHYEKTLLAWHENFQKSWDKLKSKYDEKFKRMWNYYLLSCAGAFRARNIQLWQIVLTRYGASQPQCR